jgi:hypothetical protein
MSSSDPDSLVADYLARLDLALQGLPPSGRRQLVAEIRQHIADSRAQMASESQASILDLLEKVGRPEDIAAEAQAGQPSRRPRVTRRLVLGMLGALVVVAAAITLALTRGGHGPSPSPTTVAGGSVVKNVPMVVGLSQSTAMETLENLGFTVVLVPAGISSAPSGTVVTQSPVPGSRVRAGSTIKIACSPGPSAANPQSP